MSAPLAIIAAHLDNYLDVRSIDDYPNALNGLQVDGPGMVERVAFAVDARESVIYEVKDWADLLVVHHGLFWRGLQPLTGTHYNRIEALIKSGTALYSAHLPLDCHPEAGNAAILARRMGITGLCPFGKYRNTTLGWMGRLDRANGPRPLSELASDLSDILGNNVRMVRAHRQHVAAAAVVTGAGASTLRDAAGHSLDALVTGEAQHHHVIEAAELGITLILGGHYATETFGVKHLCKHLEDRFAIEGRFVDMPTGL